MKMSALVSFVLFVVLGVGALTAVAADETTVGAAAGLSDPRTLFLFLSCVFFAATLYFGTFKFFQKRNLILCAEWAVMAISVTNLSIWVFTQQQWQFDFSMYLDAFSRVAGMNLLVVFGFLAVTHNYKPSVLTDVFILLAIGVIAAILMYVDYMDPVRPFVFFAIYFMFLPFLMLLTWKLFAMGNRVLGVHMIITTLLFTYIHSIADFYPIPGDATNVLYNYGFMALTFWAYGYLVIYFAYVGLERHSVRSSVSGREHPTHSDRFVAR